jgi:CheY-like chemotaxis protein
MAFKARILLIEDNKHIILTEEMCLNAQGYEVLIAEDGLQGLQMVINSNPDLILLDILIPKMDGYLVLEALQNNPTTQEIPVLVTSAKAQVNDLKQAFAYKIQGYLVKPFTPQELVLKISEILKGKGAV